MNKKTQVEQTCKDVAQRLHISEEEVEKLLEMNRNFSKRINNNDYQGDLLSIGWLEIDKTLQTVDLNRGASPSTCCYWPVKKAMIKAMRQEQLYKTKQRTNEELFEGIADNCLNPEENLIEQEQKEFLERQIKLLHKLLKRFPKRDQKILLLCFDSRNGRKLALQEIGKRFSISKERVRQIKNRGIDTLRQLFKEQGYLWPLF